MQGHRIEWDLRRILIVWSRGWWWIALSLLVSLSGAWLYLRYAERIYSSEAIVQIDFLASNTFLRRPGDASSVPAPFSPEMIDLYLELFSSHDVVEKVVESLGLEWEVYTVGRVGNTLVFPTPFVVEARAPALDSLLWRRVANLRVRVEADGQYELGTEDSVWLRGRVGEWVRVWGGELRLCNLGKGPIPPALYEVRRLPKAAAIQSWQERLSVLPKRGIAVYQCGVTDKSPARARRFLQALLEYTRQHEQQLRQATYEKALHYIETLLLVMQEQIAKAQDTLSLAERKAELPFAEARRSQVMQSFTEVYQKARDSLIALEKTRQRIRALLDSLRADAGTVLSPLLPFGEMPPALQASVGQINTLIERRASLLRVYHPSAPPVAYLNMQLMQHLELLLQALEETQEMDRYSARTLAKEKEHLYRDILQEREISLLQEDLALRKAIYKSLLERRLALAIDKEAVVSAIRVLQPPSLILRPLSPNPFRIYLAALVVGLIVGLGGPLLKYALTQTISYRVDIEELSPVPVLGEMPLSKKQKSFSGLQLEVLRSLRGTLGFLWEPGKPRIVVITSTVSGEGKTFIAQHLAEVYALAGHRVLLIDADLRRASLSEQVGSRDQGLSLLLTQMRLAPEQVDELIVPFLREGLFLLPAGPAAPNFPELLESSTFRKLLEHLSHIYDYIVIDSAPMGLVPDVLSILHQLPEAITLYIFRADYSRVTFLRHLADLIQQHRLQRVYLLFNGTKLNRPHYGYGYGYGYYGSYGRNAYYYQSDRGGSVWERVREWLPL